LATGCGWTYRLTLGLPSALLNPAGLTGIWAAENTRDALFDGVPLE